MKLFNAFKKKDEPEVKPEQQVRMKANEFREGGNRILDELSEIVMPHLDPEKDVFLPEKQEMIKKRIKASTQIVREAPASDLKTDPIDRGIVRLVKELRVALEGKDEEGADLISGFVLKAVKELRSDIVDTKEGVVEEELKLREDQIEQMLIVAESSNKIRRLKKDISHYTEVLGIRKEEYKQAYDKLKENQEKWPELELAVEEGLMGRGKLDGLAVELNTQKARVTDMYNDMQNIVSERALKNQQIQVLETEIRNIGNALMNTTNRIDTELTKRVEAVREKYQRQLTENFAAMKRLAEANQKFQAMLDSFFNSSEMFDYMIQNENAYETMKQEEERKKELRAEGMRRQQEEKLAMEQKRKEEEELARQQEERLAQEQEQENTEEEPQVLEF